MQGVRTGHNITAIHQHRKLVQSFPKTNGYPIVIKPTSLGGSEGVQLVSNESELLPAYEKTKAMLEKKSLDYGVSNDSFIVEEFIEAVDEISIEIINGPGYRFIITMTDKYLTPPPFFSEIGHSIPSKYIDSNEIRQLALGKL